MCSWTVREYDRHDLAAVHGGVQSGVLLSCKQHPPHGCALPRWQVQRDQWCQQPAELHQLSLWELLPAGIPCTSRVRDWDVLPCHLLCCHHLFQRYCCQRNWASRVLPMPSWLVRRRQCGALGVCPMRGGPLFNESRVYLLLCMPLRTVRRCWWENRVLRVSSSVCSAQGSFSLGNATDCSMYVTQTGV
jgi:hypothetical protein